MQITKFMHPVIHPCPQQKHEREKTESNEHQTMNHPVILQQDPKHKLTKDQPTHAHTGLFYGPMGSTSRTPMNSGGAGLGWASWEWQPSVSQSLPPTEN